MRYNATGVVCRNKMSVVTHAKNAVKNIGYGAVINEAWKKRKELYKLGEKAVKYVAGKRKPGPLRGKQRKLGKYAPTGGTNVRQERGGSTRKSASTKMKGSKKVTYKKGKNVHVTKDFKLKVAKALSPGQIHGFAREINYGSISLPSITNVCKQSVGPYNAGISATNWSFDAETILHFAGVLFNGLPYNPTQQSWQAAGVIGANTQGSATGSSGGITSVIHVDWMKEHYVLKNNTGRTITIDMYEFAPKKTGSKFLNDNQLAAGGTAVTSDWIGDPNLIWSQALAGDIVSGINIAGLTPTDLYQRPNHPQFKKIFNVAVRTIILEPGQNYECTILGPSDMDLNYANFFQNEFYQGIQKFMRFVTFVTRMDLIGQAVSTGKSEGRFGFGAGDVTGYGLLAERVREMKIRMPEQAGFKVVPLTSGPAILGYRRPAYFQATNNIIGSGPTGNVRIEEENPDGPQAPGLL